MPGDALSIYGPGFPILAILAMLSVISIMVIVAKALSLSAALKGAPRREKAFLLLQKRQPRWRAPEVDAGAHRRRPDCLFRDSETRLCKFRG